MSVSVMFGNILYIRALEWLVILVDCKCKIKGINELDVSESKNSLARLCSYDYLRISVKNKNLFSFSEILMLIFCILQKINSKISEKEKRFLFFRDILK